AGGLERRLEQRDPFFWCWRFTHGVVAVSMTLSPEEGWHGHRLCSYRPCRDGRSAKKTRVRSLRQNRRTVGPLTDVPDVRRHPLLRFVAEPPRVEARPREHPPGHRIRRARGAMAVLLPRRRIR